MEVAGKPFSRNMADARRRINSFLEAFFRNTLVMLKDNEGCHKAIEGLKELTTEITANHGVNCFFRVGKFHVGLLAFTRLQPLAGQAITKLQFQFYVSYCCRHHGFRCD